MEAATRLEGAEHRPLRRDSDVAGEGGLEPARQRPAVHGPDDRLFDPVHPAREPVQPELDDLADVVRGRVGHDRRDVGLQVGAGAERLARAGQDRDVDRVIVGEVGPRLDHQAVDVRVDRVPGLGAVDRHVGDPVALLVEHLRHGLPPWTRAGRRIVCFDPTGECCRRAASKEPAPAGSFRLRLLTFRPDAGANPPGVAQPTSATTWRTPATGSRRSFGIWGSRCSSPSTIPACSSRRRVTRQPSRPSLTRCRCPAREEPSVSPAFAEALREFCREVAAAVHD